jgi:RimJ/RimL family protein N-acetyltransferase
VLAHGRQHVELIQLGVATDNVAARQLYVSMGFEPYGIESRALQVDGRYVDEVLMVKMLR